MAEARTYTDGGKYEKNPKNIVPDKKVTSMRDYVRLKEAERLGGKLPPPPMDEDESQFFATAKGGGNFSTIDGPGQLSMMMDTNRLNYGSQTFMNENSGAGRNAQNKTHYQSQLVGPGGHIGRQGDTLSLLSISKSTKQGGFLNKQYMRSKLINDNSSALHKRSSD